MTMKEDEAVEYIKEHVRMTHEGILESTGKDYGPHLGMLLMSYIRGVRDREPNLVRKAWLKASRLERECEGEINLHEISKCALVAQEMLSNYQHNGLREIEIYARDLMNGKEV